MVLKVPTLNKLENEEEKVQQSLQVYQWTNLEKSFRQTQVYMI